MKPKIILLPKYGRLTVIGEPFRISIKNYKATFVKVRCDCGELLEVQCSSLKSGLTKSCGCLMVKHGLGQTTLYNIWTSMISRCYTPTHPYYHIYGGKGITVCDEWKNDVTTFYKWGMENGYEKGLNLDRFPDNKGNYEPTNCRWATPAQNQQNRTNNKVTWEMVKEIRRLRNEEHKPLKELACIFPIAKQTISQIAKNQRWVEK